MFSIAAINDTDSKGQWEPLAPTKEAQEFHLTQTYHEGLLKLQAKEYEKACELLESVLKDPLTANAQVDSSASDGHLLQLRFLALKNLATVFLQRGSLHYESALHCYLQAVEIDTKDSVVWNQLGTLSCSMGSLSISRWAFEQGLLCSPNNWNCMEKLLEVLIAIGDEVACLSVAELILRHWPSHSRALHVKKVIEESEPIPFAPRGIDKLEPKHVRLKFLDKRKATDGTLDDGISCKKLNQNIELHLAEASWASLADALLQVLLPLNGCHVKKDTEKLYRSGDVRLIIHLPSSSENSVRSDERKGLEATPINGSTSLGDSSAELVSGVKDKETNVVEEQPQERRSSRLERLRNRKPGKEDLDYVNGKDQAKVVIQCLEPFIPGESGTKDIVYSAKFSSSCHGQVNQCDSEESDVSRFVEKTSKNFGAYHMGHMLLEEAASRGLVYQDAVVKFLELEKVTRHWGKDRTPECSLFLSELYYDLGSSSSDASRVSEFMSEASYHLCKIIESVALVYPSHMSSVLGDESSSWIMRFQGTGEISANNPICQDIPSEILSLTNKRSFWIRFFWLSGRLSILDGNKEKSHEELCVSLSLLEKERTDDAPCVVCLRHCKVVKEITIDRVLHEINILKIDFLMEKTLNEMIAKEMYKECMTLLSPLLFSTKDVHLDSSPLHLVDKEGEGITYVELSALDILIKACEKTTPVDVVVCLNCHRRKLQILMAIAGIDECLTSRKSIHQNSESQTLSASDIESKENSSKRWNSLVFEEVKAISQCVSPVKNFIDQSVGSDNNVVRGSCITGIQTLLLSVMCNFASIFLSKKSPGVVTDDGTERCCFVEAAITFCKLQHLNHTASVKTQVDLIVAMHDLLAEYGLCCAGEGGEGEEGTFLKFAIKHLFALDTKIKSNSNSLHKEATECNELPCLNSHNKMPLNETKLDSTDVEMGQAGKDEYSALENDVLGGVPSASVSSNQALDKESVELEGRKLDSNELCPKFKTGEKENDQLLEGGSELAEDEREELELKIDGALDQCFFCLYGLNIRSDSSYEDDLATHRNTSRGDYQTKEQCSDVFQYILPCAKASSRTGLVKLRRVLRAIRKHFPQPPEDILAGNAIDKFLDDPDLCEDKLSEEAGSDGFLETITKMLIPDVGSLKQQKPSSVGSSKPYLEVYSNLYYFLALSEEMSATDKWPGFVLTKEGEEFVQHNANLFKYDLLYNPLRFESWQRLGNIYDEEVDLLLNDGSKHINVAGWRKNATLPQRVETSRRRSRRCLLMSLALAKTSAQQCEIHELLALVYYDSLQNVVPFYDQRSVLPLKDAAWTMFCENSMRHFKKAFEHKQDWSHAYYIGKLSEKLRFAYETSLSYYDQAIALNPSAVDPVYRMHASRLKLLRTCGKQNLEALKVLSAYAFSQSKKDAMVSILDKLDAENSLSQIDINEKCMQASSAETEHEESLKLEVWHMLYSDCLSALETCVEGDLKHFHKARYMLAQGLYNRGESGDLERAKDELSFCFKSSRSSFTINMWEIDSMVKKGRRKTPGLSGCKRFLEVNLPESSRKFITCIRKYLLFYLKLLEEAGDICTLERAYISLRADKRFSLCIEDLVPVALGRHVKALITSMHQAESLGCGATGNYEHILEKMFALFIEQGNLWPEICGLPEIKGPETSDSNLYGYLHGHIVTLEKNGKLETLEAINEKIRKRYKNPKLSNSNCAKVCRHASVAWCRSLIISLAEITPSLLKFTGEIQVLNQVDGGFEYSQLLCVNFQTDELWSSTFEDPAQWKNLEKRWGPILSKLRYIVIKKASDENLETANSLLKSSYNFYRECSCVMPPSGVNLYLVPSHLAMETQIQPNMNGVEILDLSIPRKLMLWAYTLLHGRYANISVVVKQCEESAKSKVKKGAAVLSSTPPNASTPNTTPTQTGVGSGGGKDGSGHGGGSSDVESSPVTPPKISTSFPENNANATYCATPLPSPAESQKDLSASPKLHRCNNTVSERSSATAIIPLAHEEGDQDKA
ncbi:calcineurin-binding protein 1 isoform X2 [Ziziphus jujuba]|uniref:Calcineurin-binding protein 1 isoform X2 n=1 Tax=Ziziphus jujuba TaxID=326968 RepID=A0A6P6G8H5_ZIZJJ|nr:calcineurin-binding protein 1 isoform X2 [Ziziphus jujuba]